MQRMQRGRPQRQRSQQRQQQEQQREQTISISESESPNAHLISKYIGAMQTEINVSNAYKGLNTWVLTKLSRFHKGRLFEQMKRDDIIAYLDSVRKSAQEDPMHKWIGTYNIYLACITRFFKWFHHPTSNRKDRSKPKVIENIPILKRREQSIYKPSDLWSTEDDLLFLKWCPSKRDRCYHAISRDLSARPHEILGLKIKDIIFKNVQNKQYAEVLLNGKTGSRHIPLIDSLPYVKDWLDSHPLRNKSESYFIYSKDRRRTHNGQLRVRSLHGIYLRYRQDFFPKLLDDMTVPDIEKQHIRDLLTKPWNPYIRRHSSLTQKSKYLKEHILRQHAGWSPRSQMHLKYVHYFGNESSESILQEYGILPKDSAEADILKPKQCPNCNEPNRPDQKFCIKCRMVLTYDAYSETMDSEKQKQDRLENMEEKLSTMQSMVEKLVLTVTETRDLAQQTELVKSMFESGWLRVAENDSAAK